MVTTRSSVQEPPQGEGDPPPPSQSSNDHEMLMSLHQRMDALTAMIQNLQRAPQPSPPEVQTPFVEQDVAPAPPTVPTSRRDQRSLAPKSHRHRASRHSGSSSPRPRSRAPTRATSGGDSGRNKHPRSLSTSDDVSWSSQEGSTKNPASYHNDHRLEKHERALRRLTQRIDTLQGSRGPTSYSSQPPYLGAS